MYDLVSLNCFSLIYKLGQCEQSCRIVEIKMYKCSLWTVKGHMPSTGNWQLIKQNHYSESSNQEVFVFRGFMTLSSLVPWLCASWLSLTQTQSFQIGCWVHWRYAIAWVLILSGGVSITDSQSPFIFKAENAGKSESLWTEFIFFLFGFNNILNPHLYNIYMTLTYICLPIYLSHWLKNSTEYGLFVCNGLNIAQCPLQSKYFLEFSLFLPSSLTSSTGNLAMPSIMTERQV